MTRLDIAILSQGRSFGNIPYLSHRMYYSDKISSKDFTFIPGDIFEYLQNRAEGSCLIRFKNEIIAIEYCPWFDSENKDFVILSEPINEWWIRITKNQKPLGWFLINEKLVEESQFDLQKEQQ